LIDLAAEIGEAGAVQDPRSGVPDFLHGQVHSTDRLIAAIGAALVGCLAGAGDRRQWPIEHANNLAEIDIGGVTGKEVASTLPFAASQEPLVPETEQDQLEELGRDLLGPREIRDSHRLLGIGIGQCQERLDSVFSLLGEHCSNYKHTDQQPGLRQKGGPV
jgi:hypothetical protein